jgi:hypothetical protein
MTMLKRDPHRGRLGQEIGMRKLSVKPKRITHKMPEVDDGIAFDDQRRLRNALVALAEMDPAWMIWVERHVPKRTSTKITRMIVERRARQLSARVYSFLGPGFARGLTDSDCYFTDDGNLRAYK